MFYFLTDFGHFFDFWLNASGCDAIFIKNMITNERIMKQEG